MTLDLFGEEVQSPTGDATGSPRSGRSARSDPSARSAPSAEPASHERAKPSSENAALVAIYADESCLGNGREGSNPGGAGGLIELVDAAGGQLVRWDYWISEPATTNNRMALRSVIEAFGELSRMNRPFRVVFTSDSKYIVEGMTLWVPDWRARDWRRKSGPIKNLALWKEAEAVTSQFERKWKWVRGHDGQPQNEYADHLATRAAADQSNSGGIIPSAFDDWMAARRTGRNGFRETAPFPEP